jgi:anthranilate phosphoribosyltransferase
VTPEQIQEYQISAADFGLDEHPLSALKGGDPDENTELTRAILAGHGAKAHTSAVAANVAALLYVSGIADNLRHGTQLALDAMLSGTPQKVAEALAKSSQAPDLSGEQ